MRLVLALLCSSCAATVIDPLQAPVGVAASGLVLDCNGSPETVNHGKFWPAAVNLPQQFYWSTLVMPRDAGSKYTISDGYGGGHALLFGFNQNGAGTPNMPFGNIWSGSESIYFYSDEGIENYEWAFSEVWWDGNYIVTGINGVPTGATPYAGTRQSPATVAGGANDLLICGSTHNNLNGRLALITSWDTFNPFSYPLVAHTVGYPLPEFAYDGNGNYTPADFVGDYTTGRAIVPDLSTTGHNDGTATRLHPGVLENANGAIDRGVGNYFNGDGEPRPVYVSDTTFPYADLNAPTVPQVNVPAPLTPPTGAKIFDSFGRMNQTLAFGQVPTLGSVELGGQAWQTFDAQSGAALGAFWGILHGKVAYLGGPYQRGIAIVQNDSPDMKVCADRVVGSHSGARASLLFRVQDAQHFWYAQTAGSMDPTQQLIYVGVYSAPWANGCDTNPAGWCRWQAPATNWNTLCVQASGTTITITFDGQNPITLSNQTSYQQATGAGFAANLIEQANGLDRVDNFTVY